MSTVRYGGGRLDQCVIYRGSRQRTCTTVSGPTRSTTEVSSNLRMRSTTSQ